MGMSLHVVGFAEPDEKWRQMKAVYDACAAASIQVPAEVIRFFGGAAPDDAGKEISIPEREWRGNSAEGIEISLADIPPAVKTLRFFAAW